MSHNRSFKIVLFGVPILVLVLTLLVSSSGQPIDWTLGYSKKETKPFGTKLLYELLPVLFGNKLITTSHSGLWRAQNGHEGQKQNFLFINEKVFFEGDDLGELNTLLDQGHNIFVASDRFSDEFLDSMHIATKRDFSGLFMFSDSISLNPANRLLKSGLGYWYDKGMSDHHFTSYDSLKTTVLGINDRGQTNFIRMQKGNGWLYLHLNPIVFTNYYLLKQDNYEYAFKCLSYLPKLSTIWDEHYKIGMEREVSTLGFLMGNRPLKVAFFVLSIGVFLFLVFQSARRQRSIPIIKPLENTTVSFVETIGRLYYSKKNHVDIASKKYLYFKAFVRSRYYLDTTSPNEEFYKQLMDKSNVPLRTIKQLFEMGKHLKSIQKLSEADLEEFNRKIEYFYEHCQ